MRTTCLPVLLTSIALSGSAQNLVVNPSFEDISTCPNDLGQIDLATGWRGLWGSADLFNACDDDSVTVPFNALGDQMPADGAGYIGLSIYPQIAKEYTEGQLNAPLVPGVLTYVSMRVSPGGFGIPFWTSPGLAASHIGLRFSTVQLWPGLYGELEFNETVLYKTDVLDDTAGWSLLSTTFYPDSAFAYVQIGCFFADSLIMWSELDANGDTPQAYAFIDKVCVAQQPGSCDQVVGVGPLSQWTPSPKGILFDEVLKLPVNDWGLGSQPYDVVLWDQIGRVVRSEYVPGAVGPISWSVPHLAKGHYTIELRLRDRPSVVIRSLKL